MSGYLRRLAASFVAPRAPLRPLAAGRFLARTAAPEPFAFAERSEASHPSASGGHGNTLLPVSARGPSQAAESREPPLARRSSPEAPGPSGVSESKLRSAGRPSFTATEQSVRYQVDELLVPLLAEGENASPAAASPRGILGRRTSAEHAIESRPVTAAPSRNPARGFGEPAAPDTTVHVHIGRIDVRAVVAPAAAVPRARARADSLLDAHLRGRDGGRP